MIPGIIYIDVQWIVCTNDWFWLLLWLWLWLWLWIRLWLCFGSKILARWHGYNHSVQNMSLRIDILLFRSGMLVCVVSRGFQKGIICQDWVIIGVAMVILVVNSCVHCRWGIGWGIGWGIEWSFWHCFVEMVKTCTTAHATNVRHQDTSNGGTVVTADTVVTVGLLGSLLTELWPTNCFVRWI
jgi:hypothetical protein